eukprot:SAG31_NODE_424_length_15826_cov_4.954664_5_plen_168_part_00
MPVQWIEQKHSLLLNRRVKWPKGMDAKGEPEIQTIRRNTNRLFTPVSETISPEPDPEPVEEQPDYAVVRGCPTATVHEQLTAHPYGSDACALTCPACCTCWQQQSEEDDGRLLIVISLPKLEAADAVELEHSSKRLFVVVKGVYKAVSEHSACLYVQFILFLNHHAC